jgi:hypothetical protein
MAVNCLNNEEKQCLVEDIGNLLGGGIRKIEISAEAWCSLLKFAVEEYVMRIQNWLIDDQWTSLKNKDLTATDICFALTTRSMDYEYQFSYAYSKQVGLQTRGPWELKKDFVEIIEGQQTYEIPAGREINEVLWLTPSEIDHATFASLGFGNMQAVGANGFGSAGGGIGFGGGNANYYHNGAYYIAPAYDIVLRAQDFGHKNRILQSDMIYKITAGPNGTRLLHLYSTPNNGNNIGARRNITGCKVWYHYYDTLDMTPDEKRQCLDECRDIIKFPSDVPLQQMDYCDLNVPSKVWVRKYLTALGKETLGRSRGKFSGKLGATEAEITMDYESLLAEGKEEKQQLIEELEEKLLSLRSDKQLERRAGEAENINKIMGYNPDGMWLI